MNFKASSVLVLYFKFFFVISSLSYQDLQLHIRSVGISRSLDLKDVNQDGSRKFELH